MRNVFKYLCLSILCAVLITGCAPASGNSTDTLTSGKPTAAATTSAKATALSKTTSAATQATDPTAVAPSGSSVWQADGVINAGEYAHKTTFGPLTVYWSNDDKYLYLAIEARSKGWLAIGLDYDRDMAGANYLIGTIINGKAVAEDSFGNSQGRTYHSPDTDLGGTNDIVASSGSYTGGITRLEVQIPLDSGDQYDKPLKRGQTVQVILGVGSSSDLTSMHTFASYGQIKLD